MLTKAKIQRNQSDEVLIRLNNVGLSLFTIARILGVHPTTVTTRLNKLGRSAVDTRRSFMEDIWNDLQPDQQKWLEEAAESAGSIQELIRQLLIHAYSMSINHRTD